MVVIHPRGLSDETTSLGSWEQRWKGSQLQPFKPSHLDDFCSANNCLPEGQQGCGRTGRTARILTLQAIQQHLKPITRDCISSSSAFSGGPVTRSKRTHQWMSGVTMLVRWLGSFPPSTLLAQVGRFVLARHQNCLLRWVGLPTLVLPRPQEMHPSATNVNPQAASCPRSASKVCLGGLAVTGFWARNAP